jgi:hypothetical protein
MGKRHWLGTIGNWGGDMKGTLMIRMGRCHWYCGVILLKYLGGWYIIVSLPWYYCRSWILFCWWLFVWSAIVHHTFASICSLIKENWKLHCFSTHQIHVTNWIRAECAHTQNIIVHLILIWDETLFHFIPLVALEHWPEDSTEWCRWAIRPFVIQLKSISKTLSLQTCSTQAEQQDQDVLDWQIGFLFLSWVFKYLPSQNLSKN